jgi:hypothetical protein
MKSVLIDTNAYAAFKRVHPEAVEVIRRAEAIRVSVIVLAELLAGCNYSAQFTLASPKAGLSRFGLAGCLTELGIVHQGVARLDNARHVYIAQPLDGTRPAKEFRQGQNATTRP